MGVISPAAESHRSRTQAVKVLNQDEKELVCVKTKKFLKSRKDHKNTQIYLYEEVINLLENKIINRNSTPWREHCPPNAYFLSKIPFPLSLNIDSSLTQCNSNTLLLPVPPHLHPLRSVPFLSLVTREQPVHTFVIKMLRNLNRS